VNKNSENVGNKMLKAFLLPVMSSHCQKTFPLLMKEAPKDVVDTGSASEGSAKKKGRPVAVTTEDMQKRRNDTFGGNEATKKTKKNQLKQQYGNFKAEGTETLEQTFNRLQAIPKTTVGMGKLTLLVFPLSALKYPLLIKYEDINQIDKDDIEEMDIKWNMALLSMRADRFWKKTGKKISIQGTDVAGFDKSKAPKALMAIDGVGWDWSFMENEEENHALVADE
nr:ribonuclease H-like domain-containing protein [Tanacetum cinerariifolium]